MQEMKIFNEDLKKYLSDNNWLNDFDHFIFTFKWIIANLVITYFMSLTIDMLHIKDTFTFKLFLFIYLMVTIFLYVFISDKRYKKQLQKNKPSNPIIEKLKNIYKNNSSLNHDALIDVWREYNSNFNSINPSDTNDNTNLMLNNNQEKCNKEGIELFQKLDNDLVYFIENADDATIKLFNLENFDSYQKLYMKYIAPKEKICLLKKNQNLITSLSNTSNHQENPMVQKLNELKNEIEKYDIETKDYFEFKKWNELAFFNY